MLSEVHQLQHISVSCCPDLCAAVFHLTEVLGKSEADGKGRKHFVTHNPSALAKLKFDRQQLQLHNDTTPQVN